MTNVTNDINHPQSQPFFLEELPFEIVTKIFSHLNQRDCLTCMTVCRSWYTSVPQYSSDVWNTVSLVESKSNIHGNTLLQQFIGGHITEVKFRMFSDEQRFHDTIQVLIDCGCDHIKRLSFTSCIIPNNPTLKLLKQLALESVTELTLYQLTIRLPFATILNMFPRLEYFMCVYPDYDDPIGTQLDHFDMEQHEFTYLKHLFVEVYGCEVQQQLVPLLKKCPNLLSFGYDPLDKEESTLSPASTVISPDQLSLWCPKLEYMELNCIRPNSRQRIQHLPWINDDQLGLRWIGVAESIHISRSEISRYLVQHMATLEFIYITSFSDPSDTTDWSTTLRSLRLSELRNLHVFGIRFDNAAMNAIINYSLFLEYLGIFVHRHQVILSFSNLLRRLKQLKHLNLQGVRLSNDDIPLYEENSELEKYYVQSLGISKVHTIELRDVAGITDDVLKTISKLPALRCLELKFLSGLPAHTERGLYDFFEMLKNTSIEDISITNIQELPVPVLHTLTHLSSLRSFTLYGSCTGVSIDFPSLLSMLCSKRLENVHFNHVLFTGADGNPMELLEKELYGYRIERILENPTECYSFVLKANQ